MWSHYVIGLAFVYFVNVLSVLIGAHTFPGSQVLLQLLEMLVYLKKSTSAYLWMYVLIKIFFSLLTL